MKKNLRYIINNDIIIFEIDNKNYSHLLLQSDSDIPAHLKEQLTDDQLEGGCTPFIYSIHQCS